MRRARIVGVDAARACALAGMMATHLMPLSGPDGELTLTGLLANGRSSALFAVLAGVGVALAYGGARPPPTGRAHAAAAAALVVRGLLVAFLGLVLVAFGPPVAVILTYYGLLFVVVAPLLRLRAPWLAALAVLMTVAGPVLSHAARLRLPQGPGEQIGFAALADPAGMLTTLLFTGYYPVLPWTAYVLAGMAVGRTDLRRVRTAVALLVGGAVLAAVASGVSRWLIPPVDEHFYGTTPTTSWAWLLIDSPHSGTPFDLAHTTGTALAVLGAMLLLARYARPVAWLLAGAGAIPLTLYFVHVVAVAAYPGTGATALWVGHVLFALLIGVGFAAAGLRGPLEALVGVAGRATRAAVLGARDPGLDQTPMRGVS